MLSSLALPSEFVLVIFHINKNPHYISLFIVSLNRGSHSSTHSRTTVSETMIDMRTVGTLRVILGWFRDKTEQNAVGWHVANGFEFEFPSSSFESDRGIYTLVGAWHLCVSSILTDYNRAFIFIFSNPFKGASNNGICDYFLGNHSDQWYDILNFVFYDVGIKNFLNIFLFFINQFLNGI